MGTFNNLIVELECASCNIRYMARIQFKYAHTWQLDYQIGDKLKWHNAEYDIGIPGTKLVKVYGILDVSYCSNGCAVAEDEFDIILKNDVLDSFGKMDNWKDYFEGNGEYFVLEN